MREFVSVYDDASKRLTKEIGEMHRRTDKHRQTDNCENKSCMNRYKKKIGELQKSD